MPRIDSDSMPPVDVTRARLLVPVGIIAAAFVAAVSAGAAYQKIPDDAAVELIATRVSERVVRDAVSAASAQHEHVTADLRKAQSTTARAVERQGYTLAKLLAYQEAQTIERLRPGYSSPQSTLMKRNVIAGRDPLEGIVPSEGVE